MLDCDKIIKENYNKRRHHNVKLLRYGTVLLNYNFKLLGGQQLRDIISDICYCIRIYGNRCNTIIISMPYFSPCDKMVYILLESVIYSLIFKYDYNVTFRFEEFKYNINSIGCITSCLHKSVSNQLELKNLGRDYESCIEKNHYRKIINAYEDFTAPSLMVREIKTFLYRFHAKEKFDKQLAMMIGELVDNVIDHAHTQCLVDIDITDSIFYCLQKQDGKNYYSVNVCIINLGGKLMYDDVKNKIKGKKYGDSERYSKVYDAYIRHSNLFDKGYSENNFFMIASFQDQISGRQDKTNSGGTGLTEMIRNLEEFAADDNCYVLSGNDGIKLKKEQLFYTDEGWIGFNGDNDFLNKIPDRDVVLKTDTYVPGTGYNFELIFEGGSL